VPIRHFSCLQHGSGRFPTGPNSKFGFKFKKMKKSHKILKNTSRCVGSNGVKNFQIFVRLYSLRALEVQLKKEKEEQIGRLNF
jgi:hypothetical protein